MIGFSGYNIQGRSTLADDTPGALRMCSYVTSAGVETKEPQLQVRLFNDTGSAMVVGQVYVTNFDGDEEKNPKVAVISALSAGDERWVVVATATTADQAWGWFVIKGYVDALVEGTTDVAVDDYLKTTAATSTTGLIKDQAVGSGRTTKTAAIACAAQTANSNVATKIYLIGDRGVDID